VEQHTIEWTTKDVEKAGYEHFMLKEIHEQPKAIKDTLGGDYTSASEPLIDLAPLPVRPAGGLQILACGTSFHAGLVGGHVIEELLGLPVRVELASEFNYRLQTFNASAAIILTQSGETADVLKAMKRLQGAGVRTIAVTNVQGSTASRIADQTYYINAGPEVSVAATKSFIAQLIALYQIALSFPGLNPRIREHLVTELNNLPSTVQRVLDRETQVTRCAEYLAQFDNAFFIGRGINLPVALEGALKLKEISYIHAEGYAAGELKHGPFALLQPDTPVIAILVRDNTYEAMLTSIKEVKARNAPVIGLVEEGDLVTQELADLVINVPRVGSIFSPVVNAVALQLLAYFAARYRGCPIDFPRNLAKSVTVE